MRRNGEAEWGKCKWRAPRRFQKTSGPFRNLARDPPLSTIDYTVLLAGTVLKVDSIQIVKHPTGVGRAQRPKSRRSSTAEGRRQDHRRTPSRVHECVQLKRVGYQRRFCQHAGVRAERLVGWSGRWETKTQTGPQKGQDKPGQMHQATVYPPSRVKRTRGSLFGPRTFSPSAPPPVICSPFPAHAKHVTL